MAKALTEIKGAILDGVTYDADSGYYELNFKTPSELIPGSFDKQHLRLFHKRVNDDKPDQKSMETTQANIREAFNNPNLEFSFPANAQNPNDFVTWANANVNVPVEKIFFDGSYFRLTDNAGGENAYGNGNLLKLWDGRTGAYNPEEQYVQFFDTLSPEMQEAVKRVDTSKTEITVSRAGNAYFHIEPIICHVAFSRSNKYQSTSTDRDLKQLVEQVSNVIASLSKDQASLNIKTALDNLVASGQPYGFSTIVQMLGGMDAPLLAADPTVKSSVAAILNETSRIALVMYVQNPETGYIWRISTFNFRNKLNDLSRSAALEYLAGGYSPVDIMPFVKQFAKFTNEEIMDISRSKGILDETEHVPLSSPADALTFLNALLSGRRVKVNESITVVKDDPTKTNLIGSYLNELGDFASADEIAAIKVAPKVQPAPTQPAAPTPTTPAQAPAPATAPATNNDPFNVGQPAAPTAPVTPAPVQATTQPAGLDPFSTPAQPTAPATSVTSESDPFGFDQL